MLMIPMECLFLCLPLAKECCLNDFLYRVSGEPRMCYLMDKLTDFWNQIPNSPSKSYVEKYIYYHFVSPTIHDLSDAATKKRQEYANYRNSRAYQEESTAYLQHLQVYRAKLTQI
mgnify:CR=1 FL=1